MPLDQINNIFISLMGLSTFLIFIIILKTHNYKNNKIFFDMDFDKPQAFHKESIPRIGGLALFISLIIFLILYYTLFNYEILYYLFFSISFFILGFLDDIKISLRPIIRLILMIAILFIGINFFNIEILKTGFLFLNKWLQNDIFSFIFISLCFLFIINGSNLIDGFNGLLALHLIIINAILLYLNINQSNLINLNLFLTGQIITLFCFLLFNFPKAKIFLGDGGAYFLGSLTALNVINTSVNNSEISPVYFGILLFYLFFEVFFSFIRKIRLNKSPLKPDREHLHMLVYKFLMSKKFKSPNPVTSIVINLLFLFLILPATFFNENNFLCKVWFVILTLIYLFFYFLLNNLTKNK